MLTNIADQPRLPTHNASEIFVESKIQFLTEIGVWPIRKQMDPYNWLGNFSDDERPFAFNLLNVFLYYNEQLVDALFYGAVQGLSARIVSSATSSEEAKASGAIFSTPFVFPTCRVRIQIRQTVVFYLPEKPDRFSESTKDTSSNRQMHWRTCRRIPTAPSCWSTTSLAVAIR